MIYAAAIATGLLVGGAINLFFYRLAHEIPLFRRPHCTHCGQRLGWEALPLLGYLGQRGRCRHCGQPILVQFPLSELLAAVAFPLLVWQHGVSLLALFYILFTIVLIVILMIDWRYHDIYYVTILPGVLLGLLAHLLPVDPRLDFRSSLLGLAVGVLFFGLLSLLGQMIFGFQVLSLGDVWLAGTIGAMTGFYGALLSLSLGIILAAVGAGFLLLIGRVSGRDYIPYGSYLSLATMVYLLVWAP